MAQTYSAYREILNDATYPGTLHLALDFIDSSNLLRWLVGDKIVENELDNGDIMLSIGETYNKGDRLNIYVNQAQTLDSQSEFGQFAITAGDDTNAPGHVKDAQLASLLHWRMGLTYEFNDDDMERTSGYDASEIVNYVEDNDDKRTQDYFGAIAYHLWYGQALSGDTTQGAITYNGRTHRGPIGISTAVGTGTYGGLTTTTCPRWQSKVLDMGTDNLFGYAITDMDTIAELLQVDANRLYPRFYDILLQASAQVKGDKKDKAYFLHPYVYNFLWMRCVEQLKIPAIMSPSATTYSHGILSGQAKGVETNPFNADIYHINGIPVLPEMAAIDETYVFNLSDIYLLDKSEIKFRASSRMNLKRTPYEILQGKYGDVMQSRLEGAFEFGVTDRRKQMKISLDSDVATALRAYGGTTYTPKDSSLEA